ncbi:MAG: hypothetical protein FJX74_17200 [Armatimonadetes bacterium]|nr:hypothetical protein [Armatimonadota bacterium]
MHSNLYGPVALGVAIAAAVAGFGLLAWLVLQWAGSQPRLAHGWPRSALQAATLGLLFLVFKEAVSGGLQTRQPEWSAMVRPISAMAALLVGADLVLLSLLSAPVPDHTTPRQSDPDVPP